MSTRRVSDGGRLSYTNSTGSTITSGTCVHFGNGIMGVATSDIANGETGLLEIDDMEIQVSKDTSAITAGGKVYLTTTANTVSISTSSGTQILNFYAAAAAGSAATTVNLVTL